MVKNWDETLRRIRRVLNTLLVFGILVFISIASFRLVAGSFTLGLQPRELPAILFGSGQVSLFVITIFIGILTIFGFQYFERKVREVVQSVTTKRLENLEKEARGRSFAIQGYIIGENSVAEDLRTAKDEGRLREALLYCDQAYKFLKGTGLAVEFLALNNYLYYSCILGEKSRRGYLLECARLMRTAAEEHDSPNLLLTYGRTMLKFSLDPEEIREACQTVHDVKSDPRLNDKQKREASYLASQCDERFPGCSWNPEN